MRGRARATKKGTSGMASDPPKNSIHSRLICELRPSQLRRTTVNAS
jgi:hypothetical protein